MYIHNADADSEATLGIIHNFPIYISLDPLSHIYTFAQIAKPGEREKVHKSQTSTEKP